jgi:hypothetical protein
MNEKQTKLPPDITTEQLMITDLGYNYTNTELIKDWMRLKTVTKFKTGSQWKPGLKICQQFCDNFFDIKATNGKSFNSIKSDYNEMEKIRLWGKEKMSALYISWIRRAIYMRWGGHNPSYYRPHLSKQIIISSGKSNGVLFDPCAGWGGRMLGTVAAGWRYVGCEPNVETYNNLLRIIDFLKISESVELHNTTFEDFDLNSLGEVDVVLTSPPYFNLETYNDADTQSYNKHNDFQDWLDNWLLKMIELCADKLTNNGLSCWNVMDFKNTNIVEAVINKHQSMGYELINTLGIDSPFVNYKKRLLKKDLTYIFKK